jgi:hypothetical protein
LGSSTTRAGKQPQTTYTADIDNRVKDGAANGNGHNQAEIDA